MFAFDTDYDVITPAGGELLELIPNSGLAPLSGEVCNAE